MNHKLELHSCRENDNKKLIKELKHLDKLLDNKKCKCHPEPQCKTDKICDHCNIWNAYWPFYGVIGASPPSLDFQVNYVAFNGSLMERWKTNMETPYVKTFPVKNLLEFVLTIGNDICKKHDSSHSLDRHSTARSIKSGCFDFNFRFENIPEPHECTTVIDVSPCSHKYPLLLNQFLLIEDPNIVVTIPGVSPTNVVGIIGYYSTDELCLNQLTETVDKFNEVKNIFMSSQLFYLHVLEMPDYVKFNLVNNTCLGENAFKVCVETSHNIEVKETLIIVEEFQHINILQRTMYINGKYFMTYAVYVDNLVGAIQLGKATPPPIPPTIADARAVPLQLVTMLLFGATVPVPNLNTVDVVTSQQQVIVNLYKNILLQNP